MLGSTFSARTFIEALIFYLTSLYIILLSGLIIHRFRKIGSVGQKRISASKVLGNKRLFYSLMITISGVIILLTGLVPLDSATRMSLYFVLQGAFGGLSLFLFCTGRINLSDVLFYIIASLISVPGVIYVKNFSYPQYDVAKEPLYIEGSINQYVESSIEGGYYYVIPVAPLITVFLAHVAGVPIPYHIVFIMVEYLAIALAMSGIIKRTGSRTFYASLMTYAIAPALSFHDRLLSLPYAVLIIYLLFRIMEKSTLTKAELIACCLTIPTMVFAHPVGPLSLMSLLAVMCLLTGFRKRGSNLHSGRDENLRRAMLNLLFVITAISIVYWGYVISLAMFTKRAMTYLEALRRFFDSLLIGESPSSILLGATISVYTSPGYSDPRYYIFAYLWALPLASSLAYITARTARLVVEADDKPPSLVGYASSILVIAFAALVFIGYAMNIEPSQYFIPMLYFISTFSLGALVRVYSNISRKALAILVAVFVLGVGMGLYSPNWAPIEHPDFKSSITWRHYADYVEASPVERLLEDDAIVYSVYSFPVGLRGKLPSYVIDQIVSGNIEPYRGVLLGLNLRDLVMTEFLKNTSAVFMGKYHALILV